MKLRNWFLSACSAMAVLTACEELAENLGTPDISISVNEMKFDIDGGDQTLTVTSTRDWSVEKDADWVEVSPSSGAASADPQTVTVSVLPNIGLSRTADLVFTIGLKKQYLTVTQEGPEGSVEDRIVYSNNFDIEKAQNNSGWPYLDKNYNLWDNKKGTGSETVEYEFGGKMSVRTSGKASNDGAGYSHYAGSGSNKVFFGTAPSTFKINKITLNGTQTDFALSFGGQKYLQGGDSNFSWEEFKAYVSNDAQKWVELSMAFKDDADVNGDWNLASCNFTVPAGTTQLNIAFVSTCSSAYSIDDVNLVFGEAGGQTIDFSAGVALDGTTSGSGGGSSSGSVPESKGKKTVQEFIAAADTQNYYELSGTVSGFNPTYCSFDLTDESGKIYVYSVLADSKSEWTSKIANGGQITIYGKYEFYSQKSQHEVVDAYIVSYNGEGASTGGSGSTTEKPATLVKATIAEFLAAPEDDTWYELTGEIVSIEKETYGNFTIKDESGASVYIYGMTNGWVGSNNQSFSQIGLKVTDVVTLGTKRGSYNNTPQGGGNPVPAYYISHVSGEGVEVTPTAGKYVKVTSEPTDWSGKYLVVFGTSAHASLTNKDLNATVKNLTIANDEIAADSQVDAAAMTVVKSGSGYVMSFADGKYFGMQHNGCKLMTEPFNLSFEYTASGVKISGQAMSDKNVEQTYILYENVGSSTYYRCYVVKDQANYHLPQLYKYVAE
jgi:hypothetical protein